MGDAENRAPSSRSEGVERGRLHLHRQQARFAGLIDRSRGFAKRRIRRPCCADLDGERSPRQGVTRELDKDGVAAAKIGGREIMIAGSLVSERPIDENEVRRRANGQDLSSRSHADEQPATRGEKLLGDENGERSADRRTDDAIPNAATFERIEMRVVARPGVVSTSASRRRQMGDDIAVRIENADFRDVAGRRLLPTAGLSQQRLGRKNRRLVESLARQDRGR